MGTEGETKANNNAAKKKNPDDGGWSEFIWNGKTKQFFGRTGMSWIKIVVFYIVFYAALAAFAYICYYIFERTTITLDKPRWTLDSSLIGSNPGVGFRPLPDQDKNTGSSLIWYKISKDDDAKFWYQSLSNYTDKIEEADKDANLETCSYDGARASKSKGCRVDINAFGPTCTKANKFGYATGEPCILIKLNRIFDWEPQPFGLDKDKNYSEETLKADLEEAKGKGMPQSLADKITAVAAANPKELDTVWINCEGENVGDKENLGHVDYFPQQGIPGYYYPYSKQPGYQSPFIFVQLSKAKHGNLINIECRAFAKNVVYDKPDRLGSVHFEVLIDK